MAPWAIVGVIGGGMTAIDAAIQAKLLGALNVTLVYRRGRDRMNASVFEQDLAASKGVRIVTNATPIAVHGNGAVREVEFEYSDDDLRPTGEKFRLAADQVSPRQHPITGQYWIVASAFWVLPLAMAQRGAAVPCVDSDSVVSGA